MLYNFENCRRKSKRMGENCITVCLEFKQRKSKPRGFIGPPTSRTPKVGNKFQTVKMENFENMPDILKVQLFPPPYDGLIKF